MTAVAIIFLVEILLASKMLEEMRLVQILKETWTLSFLRCIFSEFVGTAVFVFASLASTIMWHQPTAEAGGSSSGPQSHSLATDLTHDLSVGAPQHSTASVMQASPDPVHVSLTFGISVAIVSLCLGSAGGVHLNPAVTLALLAGFRVSPMRAVLYVIAQLLGSITASAFLHGVTPAGVRGDLGLNTLSPGVSEFQALGVEMVITSQLILCVFATSDKNSSLNKFAPVIIGLSVTLGHLVAIGFTSCSMNPARSFGPAVVTASFKNHWVFWVGPLGGAILAALVYDFMLVPRWSSLTEWLTGMREAFLTDSDTTPDNTSTNNTNET
ncbi:aquaporin-1-like [Acipenser oxyrinchus oxyrinchus]|uniref:Aquaporin-1-like n=1 Tax=Acipenser oxyrinchus oxyrinchus TaxID=40147 RepID=A0AAD8CYD3_ACIOX|nr:aquaporin-1-like [Acipenser oxyrinchus oxyrinchus]